MFRSPFLNISLPDCHGLVPRKSPLNVIALEGVHGAGKTTAIKEIEELVGSDRCMIESFVGLPEKVAKLFDLDTTTALYVAQSVFLTRLTFKIIEEYAKTPDKPRYLIIDRGFLTPIIYVCDPNYNRKNTLEALRCDLTIEMTEFFIRFLESLANLHFTYFCVFPQKKTLAAQIEARLLDEPDRKTRHETDHVFNERIRKRYEDIFFYLVRTYHTKSSVGMYEVPGFDISPEADIFFDRQSPKTKVIYCYPHGIDGTTEWQNGFEEFCVALSHGDNEGYDEFHSLTSTPLYTNETETDADTDDCENQYTCPRCKSDADRHRQIRELETPKCLRILP